MNTQAQLAPDWRRWISENLLRSCDPQVLVADVDRDVRVTMYIWRPVLALLENLLSHDECDELVQRCRESLAASR